MPAPSAGQPRSSWASQPAAAVSIAATAGGQASHCWSAPANPHGLSGGPGVDQGVRRAKRGWGAAVGRQARRSSKLGGQGGRSGFPPSTARPSRLAMGDRCLIPTGPPGVPFRGAGIAPRPRRPQAVRKFATGRCWPLLHRRPTEFAAIAIEAWPMAPVHPRHPALSEWRWRQLRPTVSPITCPGSTIAARSERLAAAARHARSLGSRVASLK